VADLAREKLDDDIAHYSRTEAMLKHLATAIEDAPKKDKGGYPRDAIDALITGAKIVSEHRTNLEYVRAVYDSKVHGDPRG
jgi:hypothetical protein